MIARIFFLVATSAALLAGSVAAEDLNPVLGKVGDFVLRDADMERLISYQSPELQKKLEADPQQRAILVKQLLLTKAVAAKAKKEGFDKKPEMKEQLSYVMDNFIGQEYMRKNVLANVEVPDDEVKKYYQEHEKDFLIPASVKVRHILIQAPSGATAEVKDKAKARAEPILQRLKKGEDFAKVAKETSEDADSAAKGGELGYISAGKTNSEEFEKAIFALKPGELSPIVETPFGYHIVIVDERKEKRVVTFDEAKDYIRKNLKGQFEQRKAQEFLDSVAKESGMELMVEKSAEPKGKETPK